jgi:hypothetical protein
MVKTKQGGLKGEGLVDWRRRVLMSKNVKYKFEKS